MKKQLFGKRLATVLMAACLLVTFAVPSFAASSENYIYNSSATIITGSVTGNVTSMNFNENTICNGFSGNCSYAGNLIFNDAGFLMENTAALGNVTILNDNVNYINNAGVSAFNMVDNAKFTGISGSALLGDFTDFNQIRNTIVNR